MERLERRLDETSGDPEKDAGGDAEERGTAAPVRVMREADSTTHIAATTSSATSHSPFGAFSLPPAGSPKIAYIASPATTIAAPTISLLPTDWLVKK